MEVMAWSPNHSKYFPLTPFSCFQSEFIPQSLSIHQTVTGKCFAELSKRMKISKPAGLMRKTSGSCYLYQTCAADLNSTILTHTSTNHSEAPAPLSQTQLPTPSPTFLRPNDISERSVSKNILFLYM